MQTTTMTRPTKTTKATLKRGVYGELTLQAARDILGRGERLTTRALGEAMGVTRKAAGHRVQVLKEAGRWPYRIEAPPTKPKPEAAPRFRPLTEAEQAFLRVAATVADARKRVDFADLLSASGLMKSEALRIMHFLLNRRTWPYLVKHPIPETTRDRRVEAAILAEDRKLMGDGRHEIDDPRKHSVLVAPRSGKDHRRPESTPAEACRAMLREWRGVVRRARTQQEPAR